MKILRWTDIDDCIPQTGSTALGLPFDVPDWTYTFHVPNFTLTTSSLRPIFNNPAQEQVPVFYASAEVVLTNMNPDPNGPRPGARFRIMHYEGPTPVWEPFGDELLLPQTALYNNGAPLGTVVTSQFNALNHLTFRNWGLQVKGKGILSMGRLSKVYNIIDYADEIADYGARIAALENSGSSSGPLTEAQLQQVADNMRTRLTL